MKKVLQCRRRSRVAFKLKFLRKAMVKMTNRIEILSQELAQFRAREEQKKELDDFFHGGPRGNQ